MKNKLIATAMILGISLAPVSAFATDLTTTQGGTPVYSCPEGTQKVGNNCVTPPTNVTTIETIEGEISSQRVKVGGSSYECTSFIASIYYQWWIIESLGTDCQPGYHEWVHWNYEVRDVVTCPSGYEVSGTQCAREVITPVPASTSPATISGSIGGSLVASVTGFLTPIWNFLVEKLLPAIGLLVILGIGVRLSIKAVRKYSKVA